MGKHFTLSVAGVVVLACAGGAQATVTMTTVPIGNAGNAADSSTYGSVGYSFEMGKYEVTAGQYTEFLNAVARTDANGLWVTQMSAADGKACQIARIGVSGSFSYSVAPGYENRPVNFVAWFRAIRFANWMSNGQPNTGVQDATTTENGSYFINGASTTRSANATWVVPSEDEWYKSAYHKNDGLTGNYFTYPTGSDLAPGRLLADVGNNANWGSAANGNAAIDGAIFITQAGEFENSASPYGTFDQGGNVREWTDTVSGSNRIARGGDWLRNSSIMLSSLREPTGTATGSQANTLGFRIALVPAPSSGILLALGVLMGSRRRR
jgi:formylglycine-generating enzyme required for sulfatase activity